MTSTLFRTAPFPRVGLTSLSRYTNIRKIRIYVSPRDKPSARRSEGTAQVEQVAVRSDTWDESSRGISHVIRLRERPFLLSPGRFVFSAWGKRRSVALPQGVCYSSFPVSSLCPLRGSLSRPRRDRDINSDNPARDKASFGRSFSCSRPRERPGKILKDNDYRQRSRAREGVLKLSHQPLAISLGVGVTECEKDVSNINWKCVSFR